MAPKMKIASVAILVKNRRRSAKWFQDKLGMRILANEGEHWTTVGYPGGVEIHLCESWTGKIPKYEKGNSGIALTVRGDLRKAYQALRRRGVRFTQPPVEQPWGWVSMFADPDGNEFHLAPA
jgi:lactoylglutathione lyase